MARKTMPTLREILAKSERYLADKCVDSPRLSAQLITAEALGCDRMSLFLNMDRIMIEEELAKIRPLLARRGAGEPAAYILGRKEFFGLEFVVSPNVLIPRPETEMLVEETLRRFSKDSSPRFADLGTGSGILAVTVASLIPAAVAVAVDRSPEALAVARENALRHGVLDRIAFVQADFSTMPLPDACLDLVLANPPYLSQAEIETVSHEVSGFEPVDALIAGPEGIEAIRKISREAGRILKTSGKILMEIGCTQGPVVKSLFEAGQGAAHAWDDVAVLRDLSGHDRVLSAARRPSEVA